MARYTLTKQQILDILKPTGAMDLVGKVFEFSDTDNLKDWGLGGKKIDDFLGCSDGHIDLLAKGGKFGVEVKTRYNGARSYLNVLNSADTRISEEELIASAVVKMQNVLLVHIDKIPGGVIVTSATIYWAANSALADCMSVHSAGRDSDSRQVKCREKTTTREGWLNASEL